MQGVDNKVVIGSLFSLGLAALGGAALYKHFTSSKKDAAEPLIVPVNPNRKIPVTITLIGDVGGTNIRLQLVQLTNSNYQDTKIVKEENLKGVDFEHFSQAIEHFLKGQQKPSICVLAIAGPVNDNTVIVSNVQRWGKLDGAQLGIQLKINRFVFINDFEANAYGLMTLRDQDVVKVRGGEPAEKAHKLIIGPGTGLGTASLIYAPNTTGVNQTFVAPGQGGHIYFAPSNQQQIQYFQFLKGFYIQPLIDLEATFCGPAIPYMFKFFASKHPEFQHSNTNPTAEQIIRIGVQNPNSLHRKAVKLFLDIYENVVGDEILTKLCYGGLYLIGSITNSVLPLLLDPEFKWFENYQSKRPYLKNVFDKIPVMVIKETELGQKGAFVYAKRLVN